MNLFLLFSIMLNVLLGVLLTVWIDRTKFTEMNLRNIAGTCSDQAIVIDELETKLLEVSGEVLKRDAYIKQLENIIQQDPGPQLQPGLREL